MRSGSMQTQVVGVLKLEFTTAQNAKDEIAISADSENVSHLLFFRAFAIHFFSWTGILYNS